MEPFVGQIQPFAFNFAPRGWAKCDGTLLSIASYQTLFSLIGTTYGGDGRVNFALPDLRGRAALHQGQGPGLTSRSIGQKAGYETTVLTTQNLPAHHHAQQISVNDGSANSDDPNGSYIGATGNNTFDSAATAGAYLASGNTADTGNGQAFNNMEPFLVINWCIALEGLYPPRS